MSLIDDVIAEAERIESEKNGRALTPNEVETLMAVGFLRKICPGAFATEQDAEAEDA